MSKPDVVEGVGCYELIWADQGIKITVNRVNVHKDGRVTGEILITTDTKGFSPILYPQSQLNFSATRTRKELAKNLQEKYSGWDWDAIIDQLCYSIQDLARRGEPVLELWTHNDVLPPEYLLEPLLFKGIPTTIFGEKGVLKTTLSLIVATCLILPWHDNPLGLLVPNRSVKALILDWEGDKDIVSWNAKRLQEGMGLPPYQIYYRRCALPLADDLEQIQKHISDMGAEVIIIDSLGAAAGGELKEAQTALRFHSALRCLKTTSLIIGQTSKDKEAKKKSTYGSTFFDYYSRSVFELRKSQSEGEDELSIGLFHQWCNLGKLQSPIGFKISFNSNTITVERQDVKGVGEFLEKMSIQVRILDILSSGNLTTKEIIEALDITRGNADTNLKRLKDKGKVVKMEDKWGLAFI